ncbi:hypothetical protein [Methylobacterium sp. E-066]|uniref:hypothetical protein n=1 Tax=Methylobacterium sp. E-066 TaxID=2836584 RepID=UPI001FB9A61F|nr:hypothetical protein [Methylobacterium sp. E-066]MCJ2139424.1 hypothetical protein [Methylobacterium sp. E-066]
MTKPLPRIATISRLGPTVLGVMWRDGPSDRVNLTGWIATGGEVLAPLKDAAVFATARLGDHGASVEWGDEDGDLAIDAHHLRLLADEQRRFGHEEAAAWQAAAGLSNQEAADFLGISLSTWNAYKAGANTVPASVSMSCRAALRDPILLQAHYRPRKAGRPPRVSRVGAA